MNNILELKGNRFVQAARSFKGGSPSMNGKAVVTSKHIRKLANELIELVDFWNKETKLFDGVIISVHYTKIVAKSNRINGLLKGKDSNSAIIGAKFSPEKDKHIITYHVDIGDLNASIQSLQNVLLIVDKCFSGEINQGTFKNDSKLANIEYDKYELTKTSFKQIVADASYIESFSIETIEPIHKESVVTLYDVGEDLKILLEKIGIRTLSSRMLDNQTVWLDSEQVEILFGQAPYLVSMATVDFNNYINYDKENNYDNPCVSIPSPTNEPTIGVIDTLFDKRVYFAEWVEYHDMVSDDISKSQEDYIHGTEVSSIIVDGPQLNKWLDDGCGRFRVRHFGIACGKQFSSFQIIKQIKTIIANNKDIKVWNLSLGSNQEINDNFISVEAAILDEIQYQNDVVFIVAGTNKPNENVIKIGSPADSINSLVVNPIKQNGLATEYARKGPALSFYSKPDVNYYGGSKEKPIRVCDPYGEAFVCGTSFAAPWIARKMSYLIDKIGLSRELAKALIIDAARGWNDSPSPETVALYGHGTVPIKIDDIVQTRNDEIKFMVTDISEKWNTYNYRFPVPMKNDKYPYIARATMCYFPKCDRMQGVDYTNTELNLHFGRIKDDGKLNEINNDRQNSSDDLAVGGDYILEGDARKKFRKWDNVKYITEGFKTTKTAKKSYTNKNWGMEIKTNNRLDPKDGVGLRFGVVVTLKEINGLNRIDEFIKNCTLSGWLVNEINITNRLNFNNVVQEDLDIE